MTEPGQPLRVEPDDHLLNDFGMRAVDDPERGPGLEMPLAPRVLNPHGGLHGGLMMVLIECGAAGIAVRAAGSENIVAGDLDVRFLTPVRVGPARLVGRALRAGRRSIVVQVDVIDVGADRKLCASATVGYSRLDDAPVGGLRPVSEPGPPRPSDAEPAIAEFGNGDVAAAVVSMSQRHPDGQDAAYLEWHMLDHLPEQYRLRGLRHGQRWVSTPAMPSRPGRVRAAVRRRRPHRPVPVRRTGRARARPLLPAGRRAAGHRPHADAAAAGAGRGLDARPGRGRRPGAGRGGGAAVASGAPGPTSSSSGSTRGRRSMRRCRWPSATGRRPGRRRRGGRRLVLVGSRAAPRSAGVDRGLALTVCYLDAPPIEVAERLAPELAVRAAAAARRCWRRPSRSWCPASGTVTSPDRCFRHPDRPKTDRSADDGALVRNRGAGPGQVTDATTSTMAAICSM